MTRELPRKAASTSKASGKRTSRIVYLDPAVAAGKWGWVWQSGTPVFQSLLKKRAR